MSPSTQRTSANTTATPLIMGVLAILIACTLSATPVEATEYKICSLTSGCCATTGGTCSSGSRAFSVFSDPWCQGSPSIKVSNADGTYISACLVAGKPCLVQALGSNSGAGISQVSIVLSPLPSNEYAVSYSTGQLVCNTKNQTCSGGQVTASVTSGSSMCNNLPSISWTLFTTTTACLISSGTNYYQSLNAMHFVGSDSLTVCPTS